MSETLCTLRTKGGGGGAKIVETVLWTNSAPTSAFTSQTVTLSDDMNNYDYLKIRYAFSTSAQADANCNEIVMPIAEFKKSLNSSTANALDSISGASSTTRYTRFVFYASDTGVLIGSSITSGSSTQNNNACIPLAIIGIKNMGGIRTNEKYDVLPFKSLPANTAISFTTKGEAKAIWITCKAQSSGTDSMILTNVNPYTGEIDNDTIYRARTSALNTFDINTGRSFTVTNGTISSSYLSSAAYYISCAYTY